MSVRNTYGVLGTSQNTPREVIVASLSDIPVNTTTYVIPWYGTKKVSPGLEYVYDWLLDNEAEFEVFAARDGKEIPSVLDRHAVDVVMVDNVDQAIIESLSSGDSKKVASLVMWDDDQAERSLTLASMSISKGLRTLELTNGLVPIIVDDEDVQETPEPEPAADKPKIKITFKDTSEDLPEIDPCGFDRETLEVMPAASVKRMAKNAGFDVKTKEDAIAALQGDAPQTDDSKEIGTVLLIFDDGTEMGFSLNVELLKEIMGVVIDFQSR